MIELRDYFAGKAMNGFLSNFDGDLHIKELAETSYSMADLMLAEREKSQPKLEVGKHEIKDPVMYPSTLPKGPIKQIGLSTRG